MTFSIEIWPTSEQRATLRRALMTLAQLRFGMYAVLLDERDGPGVAFSEAQPGSTSISGYEADPLARRAQLEALFSRASSLVSPMVAERAFRAGIAQVFLAVRLAEGESICLGNPDVFHALDALDVFSRIGMGQLSEVEHVARMSVSDAYIREGESRLVALSDVLAEAARLTWGFQRNAAHGIRSEKVPEVFRGAYDMHQVLRKCVHTESVRVARKSGDERAFRLSVWGDEFWATSSWPKLKAEVKEVP